MNSLTAKFWLRSQSPTYEQTVDFYSGRMSTDLKLPGLRPNSTIALWRGDTRALQQESPPSLFGPVRRGQGSRGPR
jgi:hypothetical protein